jgi:hypothetical protein
MVDDVADNFVADDLGRFQKSSAGCAAFLKSSERAQQQWELERRFRAWESDL